MAAQNLFGLEGLTDFGLPSSVDVRPTLLRVLTDLYVHRLAHTPDEERHYTELALRLLDAVDVATRVAVAGRLARHLAPPLRVIQHLAADLPDVATSVRGHPVLQRSHETNEPAPPILPTANVREMAVRESEIHDAKIHEYEENDEEETRSPAEAPHMIGADVASELNELFFAANADERRLILLNLEVAVPVPAGRVQLARDAAVGQRLENAALARNRE